MSRIRGALSLVVVALLLAASCGGAEPSAVEGTQAVLETERGSTALEIEIAATPEARTRGLMGRASLPEDSGMLFVFPAETSSGFWMKDTLIPLSIAFLDADGRILRILDMEPCGADPCPIYNPGISYRSALEVNRGAFAEWGAAVGDALRVGE